MIYKLLAIVDYKNQNLVQKKEIFQRINLLQYIVEMHSEPRWLDIEDQLYPQIDILKQIIIENTNNGDITQFCTEIKYNSFKRQIDLAPVIFKYFIQNSSNFEVPPTNDKSYQILIRDKFQEKLHFIGFFPNDQSYTLGQQFLSEEILYLIVKNQQKIQLHSQPLIKEFQKMPASEQMHEFIQNSQEKPVNEQFQLVQKQEQEAGQNTKAKPNKRRTIQEILKIIAEWRKLIMIKKMSPTQASDKVNMSKRSLEDYFTVIKLAEKYGFDFESKMKNGFGELRNFVKQNHETKPAPKVQILEKFKNIKK